METLFIKYVVKYYALLLFRIIDPIARVGDGVRGVRARHAAGRAAHALRARAGAVPATHLARSHRRYDLLRCRDIAYYVSFLKLTLNVKMEDYREIDRDNSLEMDEEALQRDNILCRPDSYITGYD